MSDTLQARVEVKDMDEMCLAYVRHIGPYQGMEKVFEQLWSTLMRWAGPRGFLAAPGAQLLCVYHDDPQITPEDKLRVSAGVTVPADTKVDGEVGKMTLPGGKVAVARFEVSSSEFAMAWSAVYGTWLPSSGYQPDDRPCFEIYHNTCSEHPAGKHVVDICVPVRPL